MRLNSWTFGERGVLLYSRERQQRWGIEYNVLLFFLLLPKMFVWEEWERVEFCRGAQREREREREKERERERERERSRWCSFAVKPIYFSASFYYGRNLLWLIYFSRHPRSLRGHKYQLHVARGYASFLLNLWVISGLTGLFLVFLLESVWTFKHATYAIYVAFPLDDLCHIYLRKQVHNLLCYPHNVCRMSKWFSNSMPSLPILPCSLWLRVVALVRVLSKGQIEIFNCFLYFKHFQCVKQMTVKLDY